MIKTEKLHGFNGKDILVLYTKTCNVVSNCTDKNILTPFFCGTDLRTPTSGIWIPAGGEIPLGMKEKDLVKWAKDKVRSVLPLGKGCKVYGYYFEEGKVPIIAGQHPFQ